MIGTPAVDGWAVTFGTARRGVGWLRPRRRLRAVPNVTAHPVYQVHIIRCGNIIAFAL